MRFPPLDSSEDFMRRGGLRFPLSLKPRLHDTTGCQTGCQTGLTTGLTTVLNEQSVRSTRLSNRLYNPV